MTYSEMAIMLAALALVAAAARIVLVAVVRTLLVVREWLLVPHLVGQAARIQARQKVAVARIEAKQRRRETKQLMVERRPSGRSAKVLAFTGKGALWVLKQMGATALATWRTVRVRVGDLTRYTRVWFRAHRLSHVERAEAKVEARAWRRVAKGRRVKATHRSRWHQLLGRQLRMVRRAIYRGDVLRVAAVYRVLDQGTWETVTLVHEPEEGQLYWLVGDPQEDPRLEGFLLDRRWMPHLAA